MKKDENLHCSFCQEPIANGNAIQGNNAFICFKCVSQSKKIIDQKLSDELSQLTKQKLGDKFLLPHEILNLLDQFIIGQKEAKKILSVAVYTHLKRLNYMIDQEKKSGQVETGEKTGVKQQPGLKEIKEIEEVEIDKSNVLLIGPSGSGKTLLASTLARILQVPFAIADATTLTEAGYVGDDVENILLRLIQNADYNIEWAEKGIIFIDEIDKIGRKSENTSLTRDVSGEGVQQALLKIIEGTQASVPAQGGRKHPQSQNLQINTKNILFICGGAFVGIEDLIKKRRNESTIGFKHDDDIKGTNTDQVVDDSSADHQEVIPEDLIKYGLIPELVGRLPIVCRLSELSKKEMKEVLTTPKNSLIKQYETLLRLEGKELKVEDDAIDYIIDASLCYETGARALRSILESIMVDVMFNAPQRKEKKVILNKKTIKSKDFFR